MRIEEIDIERRFASNMKGYSLSSTYYEMWEGVKTTVKR